MSHLCKSVVAAVLISASVSAQQIQPLWMHVDPLIGTGNDDQGDTIPGPTRPAGSIHPSPETLVGASEDGQRIEACMAQLEPDRAEAVKGAYLDGYSYEELAQRYAVPLNTMRTWLRRSLIKLRECLTA